ncbi:MAG: hypothetical protein N3A69_08405 [Leptospiraceae bacterium]|nr:hypothetical protein [Leptospiraceae bacterium]
MKRLISTIFLLISFIRCSSFEVIPEPNLTQITVKSKTVCLTWNWHPFCVDTKPNSLMIKGVLNNNTGEKKYYLEYYTDTFDTDLPVGVSLKIDGVYYNLRKVFTEYTETLKVTSELTEDVVNKLINTKNNISLSYSNRRSTLNFDLSSGKTSSLIDNMKDVQKKVLSLEKLKIVQ